jgi:O-antigen biosynthesis protein
LTGGEVINGELGASGKVLVVDWRVPTPDCDGASLRLFNLLLIFQSLGYGVTFVADYPASFPAYADRLTRDIENLRGAGLEIFPGVTSDCLRRWGKRYDVVMLSGGVQVAERHIDGVRKHAPGALVLFDTVDLSFVRHYREAKATGNARTLRRALNLKRRELAVAQQADRTLVVSPVEKRLLDRECPDVQVHVVSNVHEVRGSDVPFVARKDMLFIGTFEHSPNIDAVLHYLDKIHPLVRKTLPGVRIHIIGSSPPSSIRERAAADIAVAGHVPDLTGYFDRCRLSVAPIRFGAGVKGKVLMSMAHAVPTVASTVAAEGMHLLDRHDVLIADEPEVFCAAIAELHCDEALWNRLSTNVLDTVARHFSFESVRGRLAEVLRVPEGDGLTAIVEREHS